MRKALPIPAVNITFAQGIRALMKNELIADVDGGMIGLWDVLAGGTKTHQKDVSNLYFIVIGQPGKTAGLHIFDV